VKNLDIYGETHRYIPAMLSWKGYRIGAGILDIVILLNFSA